MIYFDLSLDKSLFKVFIIVVWKNIFENCFEKVIFIYLGCIIKLLFEINLNKRDS